MWKWIGGVLLAGVVTVAAGSAVNNKEDDSDSNKGDGTGTVVGKW